MLNKIVIVDNDPQLMVQIRNYLESHGYDVSIAANGSEVLEHVRTIKDKQILLIVDEILPDMDGYQLAHLCAIECGRRPKVILLSNSFVKQGFSTSILPVDMYLTKPFNMMELLKFVRNLSEAIEQVT